MPVISLDAEQKNIAAAHADIVEQLRKGHDAWNAEMIALRKPAASGEEGGGESGGEVNRERRSFRFPKIEPHLHLACDSCIS